MRTMKHLALAAMTATALALAGCGGGGSSSSGGTGTPTGTPTDAPPPKTASQVATDTIIAGNTVKAAGTTAEANAKKYVAKLDTLSVGGDSAMAEKNAQMVLDQYSNLVGSIATAKTARMAAMDAKEGASADDMERLDAAIEAIDDDIEAAEANMKKIVMYLGANDDGTIKEGTVLAGGETQTPAKWGKAVADDIAMALGAETANVVAGTAVPAVSEKGRVVMTDVMGAMTFKEIAGGMEQRISGSRVPAVSVAGMTPASVWGSPPDFEADAATLLTEDAAAAKGTADSGTYKGLMGNIYCLGSDCKLESGKLTGSWYFVQLEADANKRYIMHQAGAMAGKYVLAEMYASYGHWLTSVSDAAVVNTFAMSPTTVTGDTGTSSTLKGDAKYMGKAAGMSVHKMFDGNNKETGRASGSFTADVSLTAVFGTAPTIKGMISGFKSANPMAVDPSWSVKLMGAGDSETAAFTAGALAATEGITQGYRGGAASGERTGTWSANAYGEAEKRPAGIYGGFNAHFNDGHVAGAYATRKEE